MNIFGIGPLELVFILVIALIILGPKDMEKTARKVAQVLVRFIRSDTWKTVSQASRKIRTLPNDLMREVGMDEIKKTMTPIHKELQDLNKPEVIIPGKIMAESWNREMEGPSNQTVTPDPEESNPDQPAAPEKTEE